MEERRPPATDDGGPLSRAQVAAAVVWMLLLEVWFQGPFLGGLVPRRLAWLPVVALAALAVRGLRKLPSTLRRHRPLVLAIAGMLVLATLVRVPALRFPAGLISSDSAVAGIIAQELSAGQPAPIYAPGFPYEGTLKPHLTVALDPLVPGGIVRAYAVASLVLFLLWTAAVMLLAWRVAGLGAACAAGAFMAVSPRFLMAFSLNNVGQYPDVNALGALGLAFLALGCGPLAPAFAIGLAVWQQLLGVYFVIVMAVAVLATPALRKPRALARAALGFLAGSYPLWIWNAQHAFLTFDLFRRGGKNPADRVAFLPERIARTVTVSLPKLFGATDLGLTGVLAWMLALLLPALALAMLLAQRREMAQGRGRSAAFLCGVLMAVVLGLFAFSKFSNRGAARPRYLMPVYTSVAVAFGWTLVALSRRSRLVAWAAGAFVIGANAAGTAPWLADRKPADASDRAVVDALVGLGVRTGYSGFWVAPKYTFLSEGRVVLSGELGPDVSWVHGAHASRVRANGPDAYVVLQGPLVDAMAERLSVLGSPYTITRVSGLAVFTHFGRRIALEEMDGYDTRVAPAAAVGVQEDDLDSGP